jgi:hypothetical protein
MSFDVDLTITGLQEAQADNARMIAELRPSGALGEAVRTATAGLHRYLVGIAHVDTGAMRAAQRMEIKNRRGRAMGRIFTDPSAVNPRSGTPPAEYVNYEEARGGEHALYTRTVQEAGSRYTRAGLDIVQRGL